MADIDLAARYILTNPLLGSARSLSSTSLNDSLLVVSSSSDSSQSWYFTTTSDSDYYHLHTVQKGDFNVLDVDNYYGRNTIDMHFYYIQPERTGQYWRLNSQDDGSVKISNNFTGPDIFLEIDATSLQPTLKAQDSPGQRWTLSSPRATPTATSTTKAASPSFTTMSSGVSRSGSSGLPSSTCTAQCTVMNTPLAESSKLSTGTIAGIAVGSTALLGILIGALVYWRHRRNRDSGVSQVGTLPGPMRSRPILNG